MAVLEKSLIDRFITLKEAKSGSHGSFLDSTCKTCKEDVHSSILCRKNIENERMKYVLIDAGGQVKIMFCTNESYYLIALVNITTVPSLFFLSAFFSILMGI